MRKKNLFKIMVSCALSLAMCFSLAIAFGGVQNAVKAEEGDIVLSNSKVVLDMATFAKYPNANPATVPGEPAYAISNGTKDMCVVFSMGTADDQSVNGESSGGIWSFGAQDFSSVTNEFVLVKAANFGVMKKGESRNSTYTELNGLVWRFTDGTKTVNIRIVDVSSRYKVDYNFNDSSTPNNSTTWASTGEIDVGSALWHAPTASAADAGDRNEAAGIGNTVENPNNLPNNRAYVFFYNKTDKAIYTQRAYLHGSLLGSKVKVCDVEFTDDIEVSVMSKMISNSNPNNRQECYNQGLSTKIAIAEVGGYKVSDSTTIPLADALAASTLAVANVDVDPSIDAKLTLAYSGKYGDFTKTTAPYDMYAEVVGGTSKAFAKGDELNLGKLAEGSYTVTLYKGADTTGSVLASDIAIVCEKDEDDISVNDAQAILNMAKFTPYPKANAATVPGDEPYFVSNGTNNVGVIFSMGTHSDQNDNGMSSGGIWSFKGADFASQPNEFVLIKSNYIGIMAKGENRSNKAVNGTGIVYRFTDGTKYVNVKLLKEVEDEDTNPDGFTLTYNFNDSSTPANDTTWEEKYTVKVGGNVYFNPGVGAENVGNTTENPYNLINNRAYVFFYNKTEKAIYVQRAFFNNANGTADYLSTLGNKVKVCDVEFKGDIEVSVLANMISNLAGGGRQDAYNKGQSIKFGVAAVGGYTAIKPAVSVSGKELREGAVKSISDVVVDAGKSTSFGVRFVNAQYSFDKLKSKAVENWSMDIVDGNAQVVKSVDFAKGAELVVGELVEGAYTINMYKGLKADRENAQVAFVTGNLTVASSSIKIPMGEVIKGSVTASEGATVAYGTESAKSTSKGAVDFTGLVLKGGAGAEFTFASPIDLSKSYFKSATDYAPFIKFAFTPALQTMTDKNGVCPLPELEKMEIVLTDSTNPDKWVSYYMTAAAWPGTNPGEDRPTNVNGNMSVKSSSQDQLCERVGDNQVRPTSPMRLGVAGTAAAVNNLIYDYAHDCAYFQPDDGRGISASGAVKTLIRDLKKDYQAAGFIAKNGAANIDKTFEGFDSNLVYVTIKFVAMAQVSTSTEATIVVTKLGDFDYTQSDVTVDMADFIAGSVATVEDVKARIDSDVELSANFANATYGLEKDTVKALGNMSIDLLDVNGDLYKQYDFMSDADLTFKADKLGEFTVKLYQGLIADRGNEQKALATSILVVNPKAFDISLADVVKDGVEASENASAELGSAVAHSTKSGDVTFDGLVLNGKAGTSFTFTNAIDLSKGYFTSASDYAPFIKFAFTPVLMKNASNQIIPEAGDVEIILTDSTNPDKFVSIYMWPVAVGEDSSGNVNGMIAARGNNQTFGCERVGSNRLNEGSPMRLGIAGTAAAVNNLIYDYANDCIYFQPDDGRGISASGAVKTLIRDLKKDYTNWNTDGPGALAKNREVIFAGFDSKFVDVTIKFNKIYGGSSNDSITMVVTKLGDLDFTGDAISMTKEDFYKNSTVSLADVECILGEDAVVTATYAFKDLGVSKVVTDALEDSVVEVVKDGATVASYNFADGDEMKFETTEMGTFTLKLKVGGTELASSTLKVIPTIGGQTVTVDVDGVPTETKTISVLKYDEDVATLSALYSEKVVVAAPLYGTELGVFAKAPFKGVAKVIGLEGTIEGVQFGEDLVFVDGTEVYELELPAGKYVVSYVHESTFEYSYEVKVTLGGVEVAELVEKFDATPSNAETTAELVEGQGLVLKSAKAGGSNNGGGYVTLHGVLDGANSGDVLKLNHVPQYGGSNVEFNSMHIRLFDESGNKITAQIAQNNVYIGVNKDEVFNDNVVAGSIGDIANKLVSVSYDAAGKKLVFTVDAMPSKGAAAPVVVTADFGKLGFTGFDGPVDLTVGINSIPKAIRDNPGANDNGTIINILQVGSLDCTSSVMDIVKADSITVADDFEEFYVNAEGYEIPEEFEGKLFDAEGLELTIPSEYEVVVDGLDEVPASAISCLVSVLYNGDVFGDFDNVMLAEGLKFTIKDLGDYEVVYNFSDGTKIVKAFEVCSVLDKATVTFGELESEVVDFIADEDNVIALPEYKVESEYFGDITDKAECKYTVEFNGATTVDNADLAGATEVVITEVGALKITYVVNGETKVYNVAICPVLTVKFSNGVTVTLNGEAVEYGAEYRATENMYFNFKLAKGYELVAITLGDGSLVAEGDEVAVLFSDLSVSKNLQIEAKPTEYQIAYTFVDELEGVDMGTGYDTYFTVETTELKLAAPTYGTYNFIAWFYNGDRVESLEDLPYANVELVGIFTDKNFYAITYMDGAEVINVAYFANGEAATYYVPVKDGYDFAGWFEDEDLQDAFIFGAGVKLNANKTLYAKFIKHVLIDPTSKPSDSDPEVDADVTSPKFFDKFFDFQNMGVGYYIAFALVGLGLVALIAALLIKKNK